MNKIKVQVGIDKDDVLWITKGVHPESIFAKECAKYGLNPQESSQLDLASAKAGKQLTLAEAEKLGYFNKTKWELC